MISFLILVLTLAVANQNVNGQTNDHVTVKFLVITKNLPDTNDVYISGNHKNLGSWKPNSVKLKKLNDTSWTKEITVNKGDNLSFKFTLGNWENEALDKSGKIPGDHHLKVINDTNFRIVINNWKNGVNQLNGQITGKVEYIYNLSYDGLKERNIIIWLPPSYNKNDDKRYPVLYMHDGQNIIDPNTSSFGVDWQVDETADSLIKKNKIEEIIIVGIYNTQDRTEEYSHSVLGKKYMEFTVNKLKPIIDSNYRTLSDRKNTATMGSSMGGLISLMLAWEFTDVFSKAACFSPAFKISRFDYTPWIKKYHGKKKDIKLYIDNGGVGLENELQPGILETIELLENKGYNSGTDMMIYFDKSAEHNESAWAKRVYKPLEFFFGKSKN